MIDAVAIPTSSVGDAAEIKTGDTSQHCWRANGDFEAEPMRCGEGHFRGHACETESSANRSRTRPGLRPMNDPLVPWQTEFWAYERRILAQGGTRGGAELGRGGWRIVD